MPYDRTMYDFNEEKDLDPQNYKAWVLGSQWYPPPWCPLFVDLHYCYGKYGMQYGPETISEPKTKGWDWRFYKGGFYCTIIQTTEEEKQQREPLWREKMREILEDPSATWEKRYKNELREKLQQILSIDLTELSDIDLCDHFMELWHFEKKCQEAHFYPMYALGSGNIQFRRYLKEKFNIAPSDVEYSQLHSGLNNDFTPVVESIAKVAAMAIDLGLEEIFNESTPAEVLAKLESSENGKKWIEDFNGLVKDYSWMRRRGLEILTPAWEEDNTLALIDLQRYISQGKVTASTSEMQPKLERRREEVVQELLSKLPEEEHEIFQKLLACSQASHVFSEEHTMYVEMMSFSAVRRAALEFGRRFVEKGMIDNHDDTLFLNHEELIHAGIIKERSGLKALIEKRKKEYSEYRALEGTLPPFLGDPTKIPELVDADVVFSVSVAPPIATPEELGASLVGCAGAPGVVEGVACVVKGEEEMDNIEPDTILIAPATTASWTPVFNVIKGVVTDGGGYLTHALIVAREFGIPAVVGTQQATAMIKTGDKIRVDGNKCTVHILE
jgi:phosphohistidine swiveling domain-containing protein